MLAAMRRALIAHGIILKLASELGQHRLRSYCSDERSAFYNRPCELRRARFINHEIIQSISCRLALARNVEGRQKDLFRFVAGLPRLRIKPRIIFNNLCKDFADNSLCVQLVFLESSLIAKLT
jgi:hypothetical protein